MPIPEASKKGFVWHCLFFPKEYFASDYVDQAGGVYSSQPSYPSPVAWSDYGGQASSSYQPPVANDPFYGTESSSHYRRNDHAGANPNIEDEYDDDYIREVTVSYKTDAIFESREELEKWLKIRGREHGFVVVVQRSKKNGVDLACNRGGEPKIKVTVRRTVSIKKCFSFKNLGRYDSTGACWRVQVVNKTHNHDPFEFEEGCASFRKMNSDQLNMVESLHRIGLKPLEIEAALHEKFPGVQPAIKDIYNHTAKIRRDALLGYTPMKVLENFLAANGFTFYIRENDTDDRMEEIFFCHNKSHKMWRAFLEVLFIDTTYNTNMYDWLLVQFISVTSTSQSFGIATAFVIRERHRNFTWALEKLKQVLDDCMEPRVILTDADQALMNSCDAVFPNATKNLCRWHISENIKRKFKGLYRTDMGTDFAYWWKVLYQSPTIQEFDNRHINMERHLIQDDRAEVWQYIRNSWLDPYKHQFVASWIDERRNYDDPS
ncbi:PKS-NRPS hybrid synthetase cheA-like [Bidens hawaiensis]|uniref:PKS-NRPS hybrid synthetase cheA-like n=1 Tax=Bidens hawaiensis TaxID=980011 RepID=UPI00404BA2C4